jgi:Bacterial SH3 domain
MLTRIGLLGKLAEARTQQPIDSECRLGHRWDLESDRESRCPPEVGRRDHPFGFIPRGDGFCGSTFGGDPDPGYIRSHSRDQRAVASSATETSDTMGVPIDSGAATAPNPRSVRARRRHRRRIIGTALFVAVAIGVFVAAYLFASSSDNSSSKASDRSSAATTTTKPPLAPAGPFAVTDSVNIREGPGTQYKTVGTIGAGHKVLVVCVIDGQSVDGPNGPTTKWLRITGLGPVGYVTAQYVNVGTAIDDRSVVPQCPGL